jgi:hypothetical protein
MTLYFAYGSIVDRAGMLKRCPEARPPGMTKLGGWRFIIGIDGYPSLVPAPGAIGLIVAAAREWQMPASDVRGLQRRLPHAREAGAGA